MYNNYEMCNNSLMHVIYPAAVPVVVSYCIVRYMVNDRNQEGTVYWRAMAPTISLTV